MSLRLGDLAYVARTCCAGAFARTGGVVGPVAWIRFKGSRCSSCGQTNLTFHAGSLPERPGVPLWWLKKIDPDARRPASPARRELALWRL